MVHTSDADPHVLAPVHMVSGFGSSQTYLLAARAMVLPIITIIVAITTR
jgi:hypothetical protein